MSEKTFSFKSKEEWDKTKYLREKTTEYVNNFLHHEGLLCLTDHQWYRLEPDDAKLNILPIINMIDPNNDLRLFWVQDPLAPDWDTIQIVSVMEKWLIDPPPQLDYSTIFLRILSIFRSKREVKIYWDGTPPKLLPEEMGAEELTDEELEVAFEVPIHIAHTVSTTNRTIVGQVRAETIEEEEEIPVEEFDRATGLAEIYLNPEDTSLLERCNMLLLLKDKLFLISPLNGILDRGSDEIPQEYFPQH